MLAGVRQTHGALHLIPTGLAAPTASGLRMASLPGPPPEQPRGGKPSGHRLWGATWLLRAASARRAAWSAPAEAAPKVRRLVSDELPGPEGGGLGGGLVTQVGRQEPAVRRGCGLAQDRHDPGTEHASKEQESTEPPVEG